MENVYGGDKAITNHRGSDRTVLNQIVGDDPKDWDSGPHIALLALPPADRI